MIRNLCTWMLCVWPMTAQAWPQLSLESRGELGAEFRSFTPDDDSSTQDLNFAVVGRLGIDASTKYIEAKGLAFFRYDALDSERSKIFVEDGYLEMKRGMLRLRAGYQRLNWTATEAFHPADIVNARYWDSTIENQEKLGEPMLAVRLKALGGDVEFYYRPIAVDPVFPSTRSRMRVFAPIHTGVGADVTLGDPVRMRFNGDLYTDHFAYEQWGARIQRSFAGADLGVHVMQHLDRTTPVVFLDTTEASSPKARMLFQPVTVLGFTYVQALGSFLIKMEGAYQWYMRPRGGQTPLGMVPERNYGSVALGLEYGFNHQGRGTSTFILEGQGIFGFPKNQPVDASIFLIPQASRPVGLLTPLFNHDVMLAYRYSFDDESSTTVLCSAIVDVLRPQEFLLTASVERRLGETWLASTGVRVVRIPPKDPKAPQGFENMNDAHQIFVNVKRYF